MDQLPVRYHNGPEVYYNPGYTPDYYNSDAQNNHFFTQDYFNTAHIEPKQYQLAAIPLDNRGLTNMMQTTAYDGTGYEVYKFPYTNDRVTKSSQVVQQKSEFPITLASLAIIGTIILLWSTSDTWIPMLTPATQAVA